MKIKVKNMIVQMVVVGAVVLADAAEKTLSPEDRERLMLQYTGGPVVKPAEGRIVVFNVQKKVPGAEVDAEANAFFSGANLSGCVRNAARFSIADVSISMAEEKANGAIYVIDDAGMPDEFFSPDGAWGVVNVAKLSKKEGTFHNALHRAFVLALGGTYSLDGNDLSGDAYFAMMAHLGKIGISPSRKSTYRDACISGWATAPTNDIQRTVWDEVHELPSAPIKLKK